MNPYYNEGYDDYMKRQRQQAYKVDPQQMNKPQFSEADLGGNQGQINTQPLNPSQATPSAQGKFNWGNMTKSSNGVGSAAGMAAGLSAATAPTPDGHGFSMDPHAGYTGSLNGLSSGGAIGAIAGGITGEAGSFIKAGHAIDRYNPTNDLGQTQYDAYGRPGYNGAGIVAANQAAGDLHQAELSSKSWWQGGKAGGVAGIDSTTLFGKLNGYQKKAKRKLAETQGAITASQNTYNNQTSNYIHQQNTAEEYNKRMNSQNRMNNLYTIPRNYQQMF